MCFSAKASFATATGLSVMSLVSLKKTRKKADLPIAMSPLFFAIQQACEGLVWLTLHNNTSFLHTFGIYGFLFFAACWWPFWIPTVLYSAEKIPRKKYILLFMSILGIITGITLFFLWILPLSKIEVINHHIHYPLEDSSLLGKYLNMILYPTLAFYALTTIIPFFISSVSYMWSLGIVIGLGLIISCIFYYAAWPSVWCFFAAVSSILVFFIIKKREDKL